jgi:hypothetical protein
MQKYNRELEGENPGQFQNDFKLFDGKGKDKEKCSDVSSYKSLYVGKKLYCNMLIGKNKDKLCFGSHVRIKGVTESGVHHKIKQYNGDVFKIFDNLSKDIEEEFLLNPKGGKTLFQYSTSGVITKVRPMRRTL